MYIYIYKPLSNCFYIIYIYLSLCLYICFDTLIYEKTNHFNVRTGFELNSTHKEIKDSDLAQVSWNEINGYYALPLLMVKYVCPVSSEGIIVKILSYSSDEVK